MLPRSYTALTTSLIALAAGVLGFPSVAAATPEKGSFELRVPGTQLFGLGVPGGIAFSAPEHGTNATLLNLEAGLGYFVTDNFEVGANVGLLRLKGEAPDAFWGPLIAPFLRGFSMVAPRVALFGEASFAFFHLDGGDTSSTYTAFGVDAGAEFFVTDSWAIRVAPYYRHLTAGQSNPNFEIDDQSANQLGIGWALAAYF